MTPLTLLAVVVAFVAALCGLSCAFPPSSLHSFLSPDATLHRSDALSSCAEPPLCSSPRLTVRGVLLCALTDAPLTPGSAVYRRYVQERLRQLLPRMVRGQFVLSGVMAAVERKLAHPHEPLVMHFAGDNGVGKTRTAEAVSLALGQRCQGPACALGDSTLVLSGTAYDGMSASEFRRAVVPPIVQHARRFRGNGVLIINELTSLELPKVGVLGPVLGRGGAFPESPQVDIASLVVIITTDFGREGRTQGRGVEEIRAFIDNEFRELYRQTLASHVRTFPFQPVSLQTAAEIAAAAIREMGCDACGVPVAATDDAVSLLVERVKPILAVENGRAVAQQAAESVGYLIDTLCPAADHAALERLGATVDVDDHGAFTIVISGEMDTH